jgi:lysophospholipase L1-like esterase
MNDARPAVAARKRGRLLKIFFATLVLTIGLSGCDHAQAPPPVVTNVVQGTAFTDDLSIEAAAIQSLPPVPDSGPLDAFYSRLALLQSGQSKQMVRIVQIGDSHTAGDFLSGDLRDQFQNEYGNAGIGARVPGYAYPGVRQKDYTVTQTGYWHFHNSLTDPAFGDYGISGFTAVSETAGASMTMTPVSAAGFDYGFVDFVRQPRGGELEIWLDNTLVQRVSTYGPAGVMGHVTVRAGPGGAHSLMVVADTPGVEILDWDTERFTSGVVMDSFGVVGSTAGIFNVWNPDTVQRQLEILHPALIILAYGTNEGNEDDFDPVAYAQTYAGILQDLRAWAPDSSILIEAPTDGARQPAGCPEDVACPWSTLPALSAVRAIQLQEAQRYGAAYFDASVPEDVSGGIDHWADMEPPLARRDHVHFTVAGYRILATSLYVWLMNGFASYEQTHHTIMLN